MVGWWRQADAGAPLVVVVAAVVPLVGVAATQQKQERGAAHDGDDEPGPVLLGEYLPLGVSTAAAVPPPGTGLWLVMAAGTAKPVPVPRMQSVALPFLPPTTPDLRITLLLYRRPHPRPCRLLLLPNPESPPAKTTDLDWALQHMGLSVAPPNARKAEEEEEEEAPQPSRTTPRWSLLSHNSLVCGHLVRRAQCLAALVCPIDKDKEARLATLLHLGLDMLVGALLGTVLWRRQDEVRAVLTGADLRSFISPQALAADVEWLHHHPGGFKLNVPLTQRLGALVLVVVDLTQAPLSALVSTVGPSLPVQALAAVGLAGGGLTTLLAVAFDVLRLCTLQATLVFAIFARLYHLERSLLSSLWYLFRGKKKNILRHRTDSATEYSTPQLLLGTLLFTILTTLFLTLFVFYAFFAGLHLGVLALQGGVWLAFALWRDLPVYLLLVYACQPARFVASSSMKGLAFHLLNAEEEDGGEDRVVRVTLAASPTTNMEQPPPHTQAAAVGQKTKKKKKTPTAPASAAGARSTSPPTTKESSSSSSSATQRRMPSRLSVLRLEQRRVPLSALFHQYARTSRLFWEACPSPWTTLSMLLSGALMPRQNDQEEEEEKEQAGHGGPRKRRDRLVFLRYRSFAQILTRVAWASSSRQGGEGMNECTE